MQVQILLSPLFFSKLKRMIKEIKVDENYQTTKLFDSIKVGDIYRIPFEDSRHTGIKMEAARRNKEARLTKKLKGKLDIMYRVSKQIVQVFLRLYD